MAKKGEIEQQRALVCMASFKWMMKNEAEFLAKTLAITLETHGFWHTWKNAKKAGSTRVSRAVPHLSTHRALSLLTSEFGWDPVHLA